jgi:hypothetical protein
MPTRRALILALVCLLVVGTSAPAWAWGRLGHRVIAKLAERHLTDQAKAEIKALLEPGESLADCSTWADEHRREAQAGSVEGNPYWRPGKPTRTRRRTGWSSRVKAGMVRRSRRGSARRERTAERSTN